MHTYLRACLTLVHLMNNILYTVSFVFILHYRTDNRTTKEQRSLELFQCTFTTSILYLALSSLFPIEFITLNNQSAKGTEMTDSMKT